MERKESSKRTVYKKKLQGIIGEKTKREKRKNLEE